MELVYQVQTFWNDKNYCTPAGIWLTTSGTEKVLSHISGCVPNNNGFWIGWLDLLTPSSRISHSQAVIRTHNESSAEPFFLSCWGLAPFSSLFYDSLLEVEPYLELMTRYLLLFYMLNMIINLLNIYTGPLSVQAQYIRLCPISSSFRCNGSLVTWTVVCLTVAKLEHQFTSPLLILPLRTDRTENIVLNNFSIVAWVSAAAETCLPSRLLQWTSPLAPFVFWLSEVM
jgi:hypothetical protein